MIRFANWQSLQRELRAKAYGSLTLKFHELRSARFKIVHVSTIVHSQNINSTHDVTDEDKTGNQRSALESDFAGLLTVCVLRHGEFCDREKISI